jgi:hypothetical protein
MPGGDAQRAGALQRIGRVVALFRVRRGITEKVDALLSFRIDDAQRLRAA